MTSDPAPEPARTEEAAAIQEGLTEPADIPLPMMSEATSQYAEIGRAIEEDVVVEPSQVERGVVVFDLDGTILDDIGLISHVAADVLNQAFQTPPEEARIHYLATTGMPFEAQLAQLYPEVPKEVRAKTARIFHERKVREAYAHASPFPEIPRVLRRLDQDRWTLVVSTGAERETADLLLEREGLRYWFGGILGSGQGTKREHLKEFRRRFPGVPIFLVGDSRFDMEAGSEAEGVKAIGRASSLHGWGLTPADLRNWGAVWADYSLANLPEALSAEERKGSAKAKGPRRTPSKKKR